MTSQALQSPKAPFKDALNAYRRGRFPQAIRLLRPAMERNPQHAAGWQLFGLATLHAGQPAFAEICFERAQKLRPNEVQYLLNLGIARNQAGKPNQALIAFREAEQLAPNDAAVHYQLGNALHALKRYDAAQEHYQKAIQIAPDVVEYAAAFAHFQLSRGQYHGAEDIIESALQHHSHNDQLHILRIRALLSHGQLEQALSAADQALSAVRDRAQQAPAALWLEVGRLYALGGNHSTAWPLIRKSLMAQIDMAGGSKVPLWNGQAMDDVLLIDAMDRPELSLLFLRSMRQLKDLGVAHSLLVPETWGRWLSLIDPSIPWTESARSDELWGAQISIEALPAVLGVIPQAQPEQSPFNALHSIRHVAIAWRADDPQQSLQLRDLASFVQHHDIDFTALQPTRDEPDTPLPIEDRSLDWFQSPNQLLDEIDLVIGSDNAITRFTAAQGKPTLILLHAIPEWPWGLQGADSGWLPGARLVRQQRAGDWTPAIQQTNALLKKLAS